MAMYLLILLALHSSTLAGNMANLSALPNAAPWVLVAGYPIAIMQNGAAEIDGKVYSVNGFDGVSVTNAGNVYDPSTDSWSPIADMSDGRLKSAVAAVNGKLYVTGGWSAAGPPDGVLEIYDPATDSWSPGPANPSPLAASAGVSLNGKFYVIGGCDSSTCGYTTVEVYDPVAGSWSAAAAYPELTSSNACGAIGGLIYCAGGVPAAGSSHTYKYDPGTDAWTPLADTPQPMSGTAFAVSGGRLYVSGGSLGAGGYYYDPPTDSWTPLEDSDLLSDSAGACGCSAGSCSFYKIGGGAGGFNPTNEVQAYPGLANCGESVCSVTMPPSLPDGTTGQAYSAAVNASGGLDPYSYSISSGALPDGLSMDSGGNISGTPTVVGVFNFDVSVRDAGGCGATASYSVNVVAGCLFCDDFEDGVLAPSWTQLQPAWSETGGQLIGASTGKKAAITNTFSGCLNCYEESQITMAGGGKVLMLGWYTDKRNTMELLIKETKDTFILRQRSGGSVVAKGKAFYPMSPAVPVLFRISFDGNLFTVTADGHQLIVLDSVGTVSAGTVGFQVKNTTASFQYITLN